MKTAILKWMRLILFFLGVGGFFIVERYFYTHNQHILLRSITLLMTLAGALCPFLLAAEAKKNKLSGERTSWFLLATWQFGVALALCLYLLYAKTMGDLVVPNTLVQKGLLAIWLGFLILSSFAGIGLELTHRQSGTGFCAEPKRLLMAAGGWLLIGMFGCSLICVNYAASKLDHVFDWSYFKTTVASESSKNMTANMSGELKIAMFFPRDNEVKMFVSEYFSSLVAVSAKVKLLDYDKDLAPTIAEQFKVSRNGQVILTYGENQRKVIDIGLDLKTARPILAKLDTKFQEAFLALTTKEQTIYFTRGHGEMNPATSENPMRALRGIEMILKSQNFKVKDFAAGEGGFSKVPDDASAVIIAGATQPFLSEEFSVLQEYAENGGKLFVWLDQADTESNAGLINPSKKDPELDFLKSIGISVSTELLANDKSNIAATRTKVDRLFWYTDNFGSHESVSLLARNDDQFQVIAYRSRYLQIGTLNANWKAYETIKSLDSTFADANRNLEFDAASEKRKAYPLVVALEKTPAAKATAGNNTKRGKIVVVANAAMFSDFLVRNPGNQLLFLDNVRWLTETLPNVTGTAATEEDVQVRFSKSRDLYIFYGTIFLVPFLVLIAGFLGTRKRNNKQRVVDSHA